MNTDIDAHLGAIIRATESIRRTISHAIGDDRHHDELDDQPSPPSPPSPHTTLTVDDAVIGHRKLRAIEEGAKELRDALHELLTAEEYAGTDIVLQVARGLDDRLAWLLDGRELTTKVMGAGHLLDHGVRVVERLLDVVEHEHEDVDTARGWITRAAVPRRSYIEDRARCRRPGLRVYEPGHGAAEPKISRR